MGIQMSPVTEKGNGGKRIARDRVFCARLMVLCLASVLTSNAFSQTEQHERSQLILAAMRQRAESLRSGQFRASGYIKNRRTREDNEWRVFCAFDFPKSKFRFDQRLDFQIFRHGPVPEYRLIRHLFVRTRDLSIHWNGFDRVLEIDKPDRLPNTAMYPFDIRSLGLAVPSEIRKGTKFDEILSSFIASPTQQFEQVEDGVCKLVWGVNVNERMSIHVVVNEHQGYTPTRLELYDGMDLRLSSQVDWKQVSGIWVPKSLENEEDGENMELEFEWEKVNEPIGKLFMENGIGLPDYTELYDLRSGHATKFGLLGNPRFILGTQK